MAEKLTDKQQKFVEEYLKNGSNATQAALKAGYSEDTAYSIGAENLRKPLIKKALEAARADLRKVAELQGTTPERIMQELSRMAFSNPKQIMSWNESGITMKNSDDLSEDEAATVQEVSYSETQTGSHLKVKQHSKPESIKQLCVMLGINQETLNVNLGVQEGSPAGAVISKLLSGPPDGGEKETPESTDS